MVQASPPARAATLRAMLLVLLGSAGMQAAAVIALPLFATLTAAGTSSLRIICAAAVMLLLFRPRLRGRSRQEWLSIVLYGVAMAAMNMLIYQTIARLPLGVALTFDFLGPCLVAFIAARGLREALLAVVAFAGVVTLTGFGGDFDPLGIVWGLLAGASFAAYTVLAPRVGKLQSGLSGVALSVTVAAVLTVPFAAPVLERVTWPQWGLLLLSGVVGTALPFTVDTLAGRLTSARILGVFFALDPVLGALAGALFLQQLLTLQALLGIFLVVLAGAGIVWSAGVRKQQLDAERTVVAGVQSLEIELKFTPPPGRALPADAAFRACRLRLGQGATTQLVAQYFDTAGGDLAAKQVAVRVRRGGADAGWHLKSRTASGTREVHWPLSAQIPEGLRQQLASEYGVESAQLRVLAEINTRRTSYRVSDEHGVETVEIADDEVVATQLRYPVTGAGDPERIVRAWHEWEAELLPGSDQDALQSVAAVLLGCGAAPSLSSAKVARASGQLLALARARGADAAELRKLRELERADLAAGARGTA